MNFSLPAVVRFIALAAAAVLNGVVTPADQRKGTDASCM